MQKLILLKLHYFDEEFEDIKWVIRIRLRTDNMEKTEGAI